MKSNGPGSLSLYLKVALSTSAPAYEPVQAPPVQSAGPAAPKKTMAGDGDLLVLPTFQVRRLRLIGPEDVLTLAGKLDHYLGPKDGFDRGLFNRVVFHWGSGLLQVSLFGAVKNETRAQELHFDDQRLRNRASLLDFADRLKQAGDAALSDRLKRESDDLFFRKPALDRK